MSTNRASLCQRSVSAYFTTWGYLHVLSTIGLLLIVSQAFRGTALGVAWGVVIVQGALLAGLSFWCSRAARHAQSPRLPLVLFVGLHALATAGVLIGQMGDFGNRYVLVGAAINFAALVLELIYLAPTLRSAVPAGDTTEASGGDAIAIGATPGSSLFGIGCALVLAVGLGSGPGLPVMYRTREAARGVACRNNLHQLMLVAMAYSSDWKDFAPLSMDDLRKQGYLVGELACPKDGAPYLLLREYELQTRTAEVREMLGDEPIAFRLYQVDRPSERVFAWDSVPHPDKRMQVAYIDGHASTLTVHDADKAIQETIDWLRASAAHWGHKARQQAKKENNR